MPCGWGCGEVLTAVTVREHFAHCKTRGASMVIFPSDEAFDLAAQRAGVTLGKWLTRTALDTAARELADIRKFLVPHAGIQDGNSAAASEISAGAAERANRIRGAKGVPPATTEDDQQRYVPVDS